MIIISEIIPTQTVGKDQTEKQQAKTQTAKEIDPEQSEFFQTLKPMLTSEALAVVLRKEK